MVKEKQVIDLIAQVGKLLLQHGGETELVESTMKKTAYKLGYKECEILVLPNTIMLSITDEIQSYQTKIQKAERQDVNFQALDKVTSLIESISEKSDITKLLEELKNEDQLGISYPFYLKTIMAGIGCGSFSLLFGGDLYIFLTTFIASSIGFYSNSFLLRNYFNPFVVIIIVAFITTMISGLMTLKNDIAHIAISSSILFLVPSVAFINSVNDLIKRHYTNGITRGVRGVIISFAIAIGISIALHILGIERFI